MDQVILLIKLSNIYEANVPTLNPLSMKPETTNCSMLSDAAEAGYLKHNPRDVHTKSKGKPKEKIIADEEVIGKIVK